MKTYLLLTLLTFTTGVSFANPYTCQSRLEHAQTLASEKQATLYRCVDLKCGSSAMCGDKSDEELCPEQAQNLADALEEVAQIKKECRIN